MEGQLTSSHGETKRLSVTNKVQRFFQVAINGVIAYPYLAISQRFAHALIPNTSIQALSESASHAVDIISNNIPDIPIQDLTKNVTKTAENVINIVHFSPSNNIEKNPDGMTLEYFFGDENLQKVLKRTSLMKKRHRKEDNLAMNQQLNREHIRYGHIIDHKPESFDDYWFNKMSDFFRKPGISHILFLPKLNQYLAEPYEDVFYETLIQTIGEALYNRILPFEQKLIKNKQKRNIFITESLCYFLGQPLPENNYYKSKDSNSIETNKKGIAYKVSNALVKGMKFGSNLQKRIKHNTNTFIEKGTDARLDTYDNRISRQTTGIAHEPEIYHGNLDNTKDIYTLYIPGICSTSEDFHNAFSMICGLDDKKSNTFGINYWYSPKNNEKSFKEFYDKCEILIAKIYEKNPNAHIQIIGHSAGSIILAGLIKKFKNKHVGKITGLGITPAFDMNNKFSESLRKMHKAICGDNFDYSILSDCTLGIRAERDDVISKISAFQEIAGRLLAGGHMSWSTPLTPQAEEGNKKLIYSILRLMRMKSFQNKAHDEVEDCAESLEKQFAF